MRVNRCTASGNYPPYDGTASSGSVVANDPINAVDPSGKQSILRRFIFPAAPPALPGYPSSADEDGNGRNDDAEAATIDLQRKIESVGNVLCSLSYFCSGNSILNNDKSEPRALTDGERRRLGEAGEAADKGGRTKAGRAAEKHGSRPGSAFPPTRGSPDEINAQGQRTLNGILNDGDSVIDVDDRGRATVTAPDGRAARFNPDGSFQGFREPEL